jgi:hypothetical protein
MSIRDAKRINRKAYKRWKRSFNARAGYIFTSNGQLADVEPGEVERLHQLEKQAERDWQAAWRRLRSVQRRDVLRATKRAIGRDAEVAAKVVS